MTKKVYISILFLLIVQYSWTQGICPVAVPQDSTEWGIGAIKLHRNFSIQGKHLSSSSIWFVEHDIKKKDSILRIDHRDEIYAGFYSQFLKVYEIRNTSLRILTNTIKGGLWVEMDEINLAGSPFSTYYSLVFELEKKPEHYSQGIYDGFGINLFRSCLNLRSKPNPDSDIVACIKSNSLESDFVQINIIEHRYKWAYVAVKYFAWNGYGVSGEGCDYTFKREKHGWIKAIAENGYPNIWYPITRE